MLLNKLKLQRGHFIDISFKLQNFDQTSKLIFKVCQIIIFFEITNDQELVHRGGKKLEIIFYSLQTFSFLK